MSGKAQYDVLVHHSLYVKLKFGTSSAGIIQPADASLHLDQITSLSQNSKICFGTRKGKMNVNFEGLGCNHDWDVVRGQMEDVGESTNESRRVNVIS